MAPAYKQCTGKKPYTNASRQQCRNRITGLYCTRYTTNRPRNRSCLKTGISKAHDPGNRCPATERNHILNHHAKANGRRRDQNNQMKNIMQRATAKTPAFFKTMRNIGLTVTALATTVLTAPLSLPPAILTAAGYAATAGLVASGISQLTRTRESGRTRPKSNKNKK